MPENNSENVNKFMENAFKGAQLVENHDLVYRYEIPQQGLSLSDVFANLEENKEELKVEDYSISQTSLEQIFLRMSKDEDSVVIDVKIN